MKRYTGVDARIVAMPRVTPRGGKKIAAAYDTAEKKLYVIRHGAAPGDERRAFSPKESDEMIDSLRTGSIKPKLP